MAKKRSIESSTATYERIFGILTAIELEEGALHAPSHRQVLPLTHTHTVRIHSARA